MNALFYSEKLDNLSARLPFDYTLFLETFSDFLEASKSWRNKEDAKLVYERYKPLVVYVIRLNSKLFDGNLIYLIPDKIDDFISIINYKKKKVDEYYRRNLLNIDEMQGILHIIDNDKMVILNQAIVYRVNFVMQHPTFKNVSDIVKVSKKIQVKIPDVDLTDVYKWRSKMRWVIIGRYLSC